MKDSRRRIPAAPVARVDSVSPVSGLEKSWVTSCDVTSRYLSRQEPLVRDVKHGRRNTSTSRYFVTHQKQCSIALAGG